MICNPPYVQHHIGREDKGRLRAAAAASAGIDLAGLAGLYCHLMAIAHAWMAEGGLAGWLVPSELMDVNYGEPLKRYTAWKIGGPADALLEPRSEVELVRVHRFNPEDAQFGDALVSSAVVWFRNRRPSPDHSVEFSFGGTLAAPRASRRVPAHELRGARKWTGTAAARAAVQDSPRIADFLRIKRGLATGDNSFFILSRA